jgi:hypothetical protein
MQGKKSNIPSVEELLIEVEAAQLHMDGVKRFSDLRGLTEILSHCFKGVRKDLAFLKNVLGSKTRRKAVTSKQRLEIQAALRRILDMQSSN